MPKIITPLIDSQVRNAKPREKEYNLSDGDGLQLKVKPNGSKLWIFVYTHPHTKKRKNISFGKYPSVGLKDARYKREEARALLGKKQDPKEVREQLEAAKKAETENTLEKVAKQWFEVKRSKVTKDYGEDIWRSLTLHAFPELGNVPINSVTAPITIKALKPLEAKGSLETVKRVCQRLNEIMTFAVNTGIIFSNPLININAAFLKPKAQNLPSIKPDELPGFMKRLNMASIKLTTRCLIEWQLHTMTRPSEAAGTKWSEIDFEKRLWTIPAERMKKNIQHIIPLSEHSLNLLGVMKEISGHREYVFPADRNPKTHMNAQTANSALKRMGYHKQLVSHGLRALASTTLNEKGFPPDHIEAALAHVEPNQVRKAYNRSNYLEQRVELMNWWSSHIIECASQGASLAN